MSAEEEKLLHEIQFPAFINGRAGSGKSTMLHYAFAHYCEEYLKKVRDGNLDSGKKQELRPLFLTYSNSLLAKAQETVILILSSHHKYSEGTLQTISDQSSKLLNGCFQNFSGFSSELLAK